MTKQYDRCCLGVMGTQRGEADLLQEFRLHSECLLNDCLRANGITSPWCSAGREAKGRSHPPEGKRGSERSQEPWVSDPT